MKVGETTGKTASADFVDHGVGLDDDQGVGFVLPFERTGHHATTKFVDAKQVK